MISLVERLVKGASLDSSPVEMYQFTEDGDTLIVIPSIPFLGLTQINAAPVIHTETMFNAVLEVFVRYSLDDGLNWSENESFSSVSWLSIPFKKNHVPLFEFTLVQRGAGVTFFYGIDFDSTESALSIEFPDVPEAYLEFENLVPYYNFDSIRWTINVLNKVYKEGIVPKFIKRGNNENWNDEDFINFWWALIYPMSLRIAMAESFIDLLWRPDLLKEYLKQRGIAIGTTTNLIELCHLMYYFYDEEARRGSLSVLDLERTLAEGETLRGPIARLIDYQEDSVFSFRKINAWELGWWINMTSPCQYENSDYIMNDRLGYENEPFSKLDSLDNYSLSVPANISCTGNGYASLTVEAISGHGTSTGSANVVGFGNSEAPKLISVSPLQDYAVIADFEISVATFVYFGLLGYDVDGEIVRNWTDRTDEDTQPTFLNDDERGLELQPGRYRLFGILRNKDFTLQAWRNTVLDGLSYEKKFNAVGISKVVKVMPYLQFWTENSSTAKVYDFMICNLENVDIYLSPLESSTSKLLLKNNNYSMTDEEIKKVIIENLLPFEEANCEMIIE